MGIGQYRHRVTFDHPSGALVPPDWYCSVQSAASQVVDGLTAYFVRGRYHPQITLETQVIFEGRTFQVQSVTDVDERHVELQLMCVEVVGRGRAVETYERQVVALGASNYWPLDDQVGSPVARDLVGSKHGVISGGVTLQQPGPGGAMAMTFNGTTGKVVTAATFSIPFVGTIEAWIKYTGAGNYLPIVSNRASGIVDAIGANRTIMFSAINAKPGLYSQHGTPVQVLGTRTMNDGQWHHVVYVLTDPTIAIYLEGVLEISTAFTRSGTPDIGRPAGLGFDPDGAGNFWPGSLADIAIYPRALTPAEIAAHYHLRVP